MDLKITTPKKMRRAVAFLFFAMLFPLCAFSNTDLIGDIWSDEDFNNMYDGDIGISGVTVELVDNETLMTVSSTISADGKFEFIGIVPGKYILRIPGSQFLTGAPLFGFSSCPGSTPADDMIDNNDNGDGISQLNIRTTSFSLTDSDPNTNVLIDYIDFCFSAIDCFEENPLANSTCAQIATTDIICDMNILGTFCGVMPQQSFGGAQPSPLCPNSDGEAENISWFGFVAYDGNYTISITPSNCNSGFGLSGIQVGVFEDCSFSESVFCSEDCMTTAVDIPSSALSPGEIYYLFIDGCNGAVCSYDVTIDGAPLPPSLDPNEVCVNNNGVMECDSTDYCIGGDVLIEATGLSINADYSWTITTISGGPYNFDTSPTTTNENLQITFFSPGTYEVCVTGVSNGCDAWFGNKCTKIKVSGNIPFVGDEVFSNQFVCIGEEDNFDVNSIANDDPNNDGTSGWQGPISDIGIGLNRSTILTPGCSYDQSFSLDTYDEEPPVGVFLGICGQDLPLQIENFTLTQESFADGDIITIDSVLSQTPNQNGCDSIINYAIEKLDVADGVMNSPQCTFNSVILDFDYNVPESTNFIFLNFVWQDPLGNILVDPQGNNDQTDMEVPVGSPSGIYTLTVTVTKNGFSCDYVYTVDVDFSNIIPPTPSISGITLVCGGANSEATYTAMGGDPAFNFIWTVPANASIISTMGPFGDMITVDWSGSTGGEVTVQSENQCGFSEVATLDINVIPTNTPDFDLVSEVCIGGETSVSSAGNDVNVTSYFWNFDGAQVISGGAFNLGPNVISWTTSGTKTITLQTTNTSGCTSEMAIKTIEVITPIEPATVICQPAINDVLFIWTPEMGVDYSVEIFTGQTGVFEGNSAYRVSDLSGGETVTLELKQTQTNGLCTDPVTTLVSCTAQDCPFIAISLSSQQTSFCETEPGQTQINAIVTSNVNGTGTFSGSGIVNPMGLFDPKEANIGVNTITYTYVDINGCSAIETIDLTVTEGPTAEFTADQMTVCLGGSIQLSYTGTSGVNNFDWQNSEISIPSIANPTIVFESTGIKTITLTVTKDGCISQAVSMNVTVEDLPEATFVLDSDTICISGEAQLIYTGGGNVDNFDWDVGVGNVDNVPNPIVSFISPGEKEIELIVSIGDCVSEVYTQTLFVESILESININCSEGQGLIDFSWNPVEGASSYLLTVGGGIPFTIDNTSITINNLGNNEEVEFTVEAISDGTCPNVLSSVTCTTLISSTVENDITPVVLYPNPVNSVLFMEELGDLKNYTIHDINGRKILEGVYDSGIDTRELTDGLYFIKLSSSDHQKRQLLKFLKK